MKELTWIEISKSNIKHNIKTIRRVVGKNTIIAPAVKANAYGHGLVAYSRLLLSYGADWLCVNSIFEAEALRRAGINKPILVIGYVQLPDLKKLTELDLKILVYNRESIKKLSQIAKKAKKNVSVHLKVDTGMSRQGILPGEIDHYVRLIKQSPGLELEGIATHFATSEELKNKAHFIKQLAEFEKLYKELKQYNIPIFHTSNSAATLISDKARFQLVRPGISIYGYYPSKDVEKVCKRKKIILKPILTLKTKVAQVKDIAKGACVSYGCTYRAKKNMKVAVLPIGYYDGIDRKLSNQGEVLIRGKRCRILGRVCMNICVVDVSQVKGVKLEDEVVVIGRQGKEEITVGEVAEKIGTINYEVTTRLRESISRYYL